MNGNSVLECLKSRIILEHSNNFKKTGDENVELKTIRDVVIEQSEYLTPTARAVIKSLARDKKTFNPTRPLIAAKVGKSIRSVSYAIKQLETYGILKREAFRRKLERGRTEKSVKYHLNHISLWRLPDAEPIARRTYPKLDFHAMIAYEHRKYCIGGQVDFGKIIALGQKTKRGRKPKPKADSMEQVNVTSCKTLHPDTLKPNSITDNLNSEKIKKAKLTDLMRKVFCRIGVFPGIDLNAPASYRDCLDKLRNEILAGLKTENPRLDLEAMLYTAFDSDLLSRMAFKSKTTQLKMREAAFWIAQINAGEHLHFRKQLGKSA